MITPNEREEIAYNEGYRACEKEYKRGLDQNKKDQDEIRVLRTEWETIVKIVQQTYLQHNDTQLKMDYQNTFMYSNDPRLSVPADWNEFQEEVGRLVKMGRDFELLLKGIEEHAVLKGTWDKLLMTFKLIEP